MKNNSFNKFEKARVMIKHSILNAIIVEKARALPVTMAKYRTRGLVYEFKKECIIP